MDDNNRDLYISEIITHYLQSHYPTQYGDNAIVNNYKEFLELSKAKSELKDKFNKKSLSRLEALNEYFYGNSDGSYSGTGNDLGRQYVTTINTIKSILKSNEDAAKDIVAIWHDETHLNKFFNENYDDVDILHSQFAYPEKWQLNCTPVIIHKDKDSSIFKRFSGK
jgi:hypothetical protein